MPPTLPPSGTVTLLFTDIEGSTKLWEAHPDEMRHALARHDDLLRQAIEESGGYVFKTIGDAFCAAFAGASDALKSSLDAQLAVHSEPWPKSTPIKVRMALHTGVVESRSDDYFGPTVNRVARLLATAYGGQTLLSQATRNLVCDSLPEGVDLRELGAHRLKDLEQPEQVFQLRHPGLPSSFPPIRSLSNHPNNLPQQVSSFIGRQRELAAVKELLAKSRLLSLLGAGGCGKTRLALQVAADTLEQFPDGAWCVELAPISDPELVPQAVAAALNLKEQAGKSPTTTVVEHIGDKRLLLLIDNCEHQLDACARLVQSVLSECPFVRILSTSREALGISGEQTYRVPSLAVPDRKGAETPESLARCDAARLFVDRALLVSAGFQVTSRNASAVASVCRRLDGIPLAIEMAAARVRSLSVEEVDQRLDQRFRLLTGGSRTAIPRQQTLRALIDWSYDLLNPDEQKMLEALSVFSGGWTLSAAEQVCAAAGIDELDAYNLLSSLVDKSLVIWGAHEDETRYRMLETVRAYGWEKLVSVKSDTLLLRGHRRYFLKLTEEIKPQLSGPDQGFLLDILEAEHDNLRQAITSCLESPTDVQEAALVAANLHQFWIMRCHFTEGRERLSELLELDATRETPQIRADALNTAGVLAYQVGDYGAAKGYHEECLVIRRSLADKIGIANSLNNLGNIAREQGDYASAEVAFEESLALRSEIGDRNTIASSLNNLGLLAWNMRRFDAASQFLSRSLEIKQSLEDDYGVANALNGLGLVMRDVGDLAKAQAHFEKSLGIRRALHDSSGIAMSINNIGMLAQLQGDFETARTLYFESLGIKLEIGDHRGVLYSLEMIAGLYVKEGSYLEAAELWGAADVLRERLGASMPPAERAIYERDVAAARQGVGDDAFAEAWAEGRRKGPPRELG